MLKFLILVALAAIDGANCAAKLNTVVSAPWIVSLQIKDTSGKSRWICAGSIASKDWIVTAASCLSDSNDPKSYLIVAGTADRTNPGSTHEVSKIVKHKEFATTTLRASVNDIALMKVKSPFVLDETRRAPELNDKSPLPDNTPVLTSGWGYGVRSKTAPNLLHIKNEKIMPIKKCQEYYEPRIPAKQFCATHDITEFFTRHERGNPIIVNERLAGIGTWSAGGRTPDIFTDISQYRDWIKTNMAA